VTKQAEHAEARVFVKAHGRELRVTVNGALMLSRLFRASEPGRALGGESTATLENFLGQGWTLTPERGSDTHSRSGTHQPDSEAAFPAI
jgi:hypothetical protein